MTIFEYITVNKTAYEKPIQLEDGWSWSMKADLRKAFLYKNSQFTQHNDNRDLRPNKNIILAIMNIQYRTIDFDVKDIGLYVDNPKEYFKSFLVKSFHNKWSLENFIDTFIDDVVVSYSDYGGVLARDTNENRAEVIDLRTLAFCNQTDILANPFCIEHSFSQSQLRKQKNWGKIEKGAQVTIEELIILAKKDGDLDNVSGEIKIYEVHGVLPSEYLEDNDRDGYHDIDLEKEDIQQVQIVAEYTDENKHHVGVTLFKSKEPTLPFKFLARDKIDGRALGRGGIEELFQPQIWTNWNESKITEMLDAASKNLNWTDDATVKSRNNLNDMENNEIVVLAEGKKIGQINTFPKNLVVFNNALDRWDIQAQKLGSASELSLGETPTAGTPFKSVEAQLIEGKGMHIYRQGQIATFMDEIYRDWIIPHIKGEIVKDNKFLSELSSEDMIKVAEDVSNNIANKKINEKILNGEIPTVEEKALFKQIALADFGKSNKKFIEILKDEMKDDELSVMTNIVGKQKNLSLLTDKLVNVLRQYIATPEIRQDPGMTKLLNTILESSGLSPISFSPAPMLAPPQPQQGGGGTQPLKEFTQVEENQPAQ